MIKSLQAGDFIDIDEYVDKLKDAGFDADYKNIYDDFDSWLAIVNISGEDHMSVMHQTGMTMVKKVYYDLDDFEPVNLGNSSIIGRVDIFNIFKDYDVIPESHDILEFERLVGNNFESYHEDLTRWVEHYLEKKEAEKDDEDN